MIKNSIFKHLRISVLTSSILGFSLTGYTILNKEVNRCISPTMFFQRLGAKKQLEEVVYFCGEKIDTKTPGPGHYKPYYYRDFGIDAPRIKILEKFEEKKVIPIKGFDYIPSAAFDNNLEKIRHFHKNDRKNFQEMIKTRETLISDVENTSKELYQLSKLADDIYSCQKTPHYYNCLLKNIAKYTCNLQDLKRLINKSNTKESFKLIEKRINSINESINDNKVSTERELVRLKNQFYK